MLRKLIAQHAYTAPPYPTSWALVNSLSEQTPPSYQYLIKDLLEEITLFSNRTLEATAHKRADGKYDVTLTVDTHKFKADPKGNETEVALDDWIEIGAFAKPEKGRKYGRTLYRDRIHMTQGSWHVHLHRERASGQSGRGSLQSAGRPRARRQRERDALGCRARVREISGDSSARRCVSDSPAAATLDFYFSKTRDATAAKRFFDKVLAATNHPRERVINVDGNPSYPKAVSRLKPEGKLGRRCRCRTALYLNNIVEQDHRALKRRLNAKQGFRSFKGARRTIPGYEVTQHDPERASEVVAERGRSGQVLFINLTLGLKTV